MVLFIMRVETYKTEQTNNRSSQRPSRFFERQYIPRLSILAILLRKEALLASKVLSADPGSTENAGAFGGPICLLRLPGGILDEAER